MRKVILIYISFFSLLFNSCQKVLLKNDIPQSPENVFNYLWEDVKNRYSFFELKGINWDSIKTEYLPRIQNNMSQEDLFEVLAEMLGELQDGHVNLTSTFDRSRNWDWFLDFPPNFNHEIVYRNYLGRDYRMTGPLHNQIIDSVLYVYYQSFMNTISDAQLDNLIARAHGLKGIVFDVRNNGGGASENADRIASRFTDKKIIVGKRRMKSGPGKNDFTPWVDIVLNPSNRPRYTGKIILLTNKLSYSATTGFALLMKSLPTVTMIGASTGGGGGTPAFGELPNGWTYRFSATQTIDNEGRQTELGIQTDLEVELLKTDEDAGVDTIIEEALILLR